jgi:hypothetical protein
MAHGTIRRIVTLSAFALVSTTVTLAQSPALRETAVIPISNTWQGAQLAFPAKSKLIVVTLDKPNRRQTCHLRSYTADELVCSRAFGGPRTYLRQQVVALILPGDRLSKLFFVIGSCEFGAAIWGSVVLAATCPACGVGTGIAAFFYFGVAALFVTGDDQPDRLLYLAPGQQLSRKLRHVQS